jgi:hypothetical protein
VTALCAFAVVGNGAHQMIPPGRVTVDTVIQQVAHVHVLIVGSVSKESKNSAHKTFTVDDVVLAADIFDAICFSRVPSQSANE